MFDRDAMAHHPDAAEAAKEARKRKTEDEYRAAYQWFVRNDDPTPEGRNQRELVSERLQAARDRATEAGMTEERMDEIEAEEAEQG